MQSSSPAIGRPIPSNWSRLNVAMHWLVVVLVAAQALDHESMIALWDGTLEGKVISAGDTVVGWFHIVAGTMILAATAIRLVDRLVAGRPPRARDPQWADRLARVTHVLLYGVVLVMPSLGLAAWITGNDAIAGLHTALWTPLLILIALHVLGALTQHFVFRSDVLRRMLGLSSRKRHEALDNPSPPPSGTQEVP